MTQVTTSRAASGARILGDDVQHLIAWYHVLRTQRADSTITELAVEADGAGNVASAASAVFEYDATAPAVTVSPGRSPDANGWYNHAVTFTPAGMMVPFRPSTIVKTCSDTVTALVDFRLATLKVTAGKSAVLPVALTF